jgi:CRP/FNR family cyclic AMP-dependent transcriptional regulator
LFSLAANFGAGEGARKRIVLEPEAEKGKSRHMRESAQSLAGLPLFSDLNEADIETLLGQFERRTLKKGATLFAAGVAADTVYFLMEGSVSLRRDGEEVLVAQSPAPLGELSALTGEDRNLTAVADSDVVVLAASTESLKALFENNGALAYQFQTNLLRLAARKIARDRRRLLEMRENIVNTQKAMKTMREALLEAEDNPLHASLYEELDALIEHNRRIHYRVEPSLLVPTGIQLSDGDVRRVRALSNEWVHFSGSAGKLKEGDEITAILLLDGEPLPVSGTVDRIGKEEVTLFLDEVVEPLLEKLTKHLTRAQMLDVVL